jgi:DNA invertase Pin-like site-specific DNA recombinase
VENLTKAVGYLRVSTEEQGRSGLGLEAQDQAIRLECRRRGWDLIKMYQDVLSGKDLHRPGVTAALAAVESGAATVLVVAKLDRLSRSLNDFAGLMARALDGGWNLVALDLGVDLSTPPGEFLANVMASMAQWERRIISQRTKDALAVKKSQGFRLGRTDCIPPVIVERIRAMSEAGFGLSATARRLNDENVPTAHGGARWYPSTIRAVLERQVDLPEPEPEAA